MLSCNGEAQRLNSSNITWLAPVLTTICGWSTAAGTETGPTTTEVFEVDATGATVAFSV